LDFSVYKRARNVLGLLQLVATWWSYLSSCKTIALDDGTRLKADNFERPQLLVESGKPTHLFIAVGIKGEGKKRGYAALEKSWNLCIPLE